MKIITINKKALHNYEVIDTFEAGIALTGSEVKSLREGRVSLKNAYVEIKDRQALLVNTHISSYPCASYNNHDPERRRRLLLHKREIHRLDQKVKEKKMSIVPLRIYITSRGLIKIEIALAKGKRQYEKREQIKERDIQREMDRELKWHKKK